MFFWKCSFSRIRSDIRWYSNISYTYLHTRNAQRYCTYIPVKLYFLHQWRDRFDATKYYSRTHNSANKKYKLTEARRDAIFSTNAMGTGCVYRETTHLNSLTISAPKTAARCLIRHSRYLFAPKIRHGRVKIRNVYGALATRLDFEPEMT